MKRYILFTIIAFASCITIKAQDSLAFQDRVTVGIKTGFAFPDMRYSDGNMDMYHHNAYCRGSFSVFSDIVLWKGLSVRPELTFIGRGTKLNYQNAIDYKLKATYFDIRVPIIWTFLKDYWIQPYVTIAPNLDFALGGKINYDDGYDSYEIKLSKGNFRPVDFGLFFGAGTQFVVDIKTWKFNVGVELGYNLGLVNTFSKQEQYGNINAVNNIYEDIKGTRKNGGVELSFMVGFPLSNLTTHKSKKEPKQKKEEPVIQPKADNAVKIKAKDCYSLQEMMAFITLGEDISDKAICMFDLKFDFGKATIRNESKKQLDEIVDMLEQFPDMTIQINGHTDNVGSAEYNQKLSEQRAKAVYDYFVKSGIEARRMNYKGQGFDLPIDTNDTEEGRSRNRRVEIEILTINK